MNRLSLLALQALVAVIVIAFWQVASTTTLIGNPDDIAFFFSTPLAVAGRFATARYDGPARQGPWRRWCPVPATVRHMPRRSTKRRGSSGAAHHRNR